MTVFAKKLERLEPERVPKLLNCLYAGSRVDPGPWCDPQLLNSPRVSYNETFLEWFFFRWTTTYGTTRPWCTTSSGLCGLVVGRHLPWSQSLFRCRPTLDFLLLFALSQGHPRCRARHQVSFFFYPAFVEGFQTTYPTTPTPSTVSRYGPSSLWDLREPSRNLVTILRVKHRYTPTRLVLGPPTQPLREHFVYDCTGRVTDPKPNGVNC